MRRCDAFVTAHFLRKKAEEKSVRKTRKLTEKVKKAKLYMPMRIFLLKIA